VSVFAVSFARMPILLDVLSFAVFTGFAFVSVCAMTRGGRGWPWRILAFGTLAAVDAALEVLWMRGNLRLDLWLGICFAVKWTAISAMVFLLSRDPLGRRLFLSIVYGAYAVCYAAAFHLLAYRNVFGLPGGVAGAVGLAVVAAANLAFLFWVLPSVPQGGGLKWRDPCMGAAVLLLHLFGAGIWPLSVVTASAPNCILFALVSVTAWVVFPLLCRSLRIRLVNAQISHNLELMLSEVKARRSAIDLSRRIRHDQRHHRAQIAEYMLLGQYERVFDYLKELDEEDWEAPTDKLVWCENETVNAILSGCARKAAAAGVEFVAEAHVGRMVGLPDVELVAVFANLIENAVEAAEKLEGATSPVKVLVRQRAFGIGITVTNPVPTGFALSADGFPCAEPGLGMESVRRVVGRHDGTWTYELNDGLLTCQAILMLERDEPCA